MHLKKKSKRAMCELFTREGYNSQPYSVQMFKNLADHFDERISIGTVLTEIRQLF